MQEKAKKGFTLIELVIALAILITVFAISFSAIANFYRLRLVYDQEIVLQQNLRFALDRMSDDFRQANKDPTQLHDIILSPADNAMGSELIFTRYNGTSTDDIRYKIEGTAGSGYTINKVEYLHGTVPPNTGQPVTEEMKQLVEVYFVRQGGKVVVILVGTIKYFGKENTISYTSLVYSRNSKEQH
jgi:type II secretory pathway pseudopilin PulG